MIFISGKWKAKLNIIFIFSFKHCKFPRTLWFCYSEWGPLIRGTHISWGLPRNGAFWDLPRPAELESDFFFFFLESPFKQDRQGKSVHIMVCVGVMLRIISYILLISSCILIGYTILYFNDLKLMIMLVWGKAFLIFSLYVNFFSIY